jgi:anthranilate phosphoribosyltransferase
MVLGGVAQDLAAGIELAEEAIVSGAANEKLRALVDLSNRLAAKGDS